MQPQPTVTATFEESAAELGRNLAATLTTAITTLAPPSTGPQQLAKLAGVDKGIASRLLTAIRARDPFTTLSRIPGPEPVRRIIRALQRRGTATEIVRAAELAIDQFEQLVRQSAGDRATFDGIIAQLLPDARRQFESRTRQLLYRGHSQLKGFSSEVEFTTVLVQPSREGEFVDYIVLFGMQGLRRHRPGAEVRLATWMMFHDRPPWQLTTLDGQPLTDWSAGRLDDFSTAPPPRIRVRESGDTYLYTLADENFGPDSSVDLVFAQWSRNTAPLYSDPPERRRTGLGAEVDRPTRVLQLDALVRDDVYPDCEPELFVIDTSFRGMANINDPGRAPDRIDGGETITPLGRDPRNFRSALVARYGEMLTEVARKAGSDLKRFRGYRTVIEYPPYGSQITMGFPRPFRPDGAATS